MIENPVGWVSPCLNVRFALADGALETYRPDGERFATYLELIEQNQQAQQRLEQERQRFGQISCQTARTGHQSRGVVKYAMTMTVGKQLDDNFGDY